MTDQHTVKLCSACRRDKPLDDFYRKASAADGRQTYCKTCQDSRNAGWATANPDRRAVTSRAAAFFRKYGITFEQRDAMLAEQGGVCAICERAYPGGRWDEWHVDHCHETGAIRGILCNDCNAGLGILGDDPVRLRRAADYLEEARDRA